MSGTSVREADATGAESASCGERLAAGVSVDLYLGRVLLSPVAALTSVTPPIPHAAVEGGCGASYAKTRSDVMRLKS